MQRTPPKQDSEDKMQSGPSLPETDHESETHKVTRRRVKTKRVPGDDMDAAITFKFSSFKHDLTEHITNLFTTFQEKQDVKLTTLLSNISEVKKEVSELKKFSAGLEQKVIALTAHHDTCSVKTAELTCNQEASCAKINYYTTHYYSN